MKRALILVDLQNDFISGSLPVPRGGETIAVANALSHRRDIYSLVVATQDWHPPGHKSFAANHPGKNIMDIIELHGATQILWPVHCQQGTWGAEFHADLDRDGIDVVIRKGTDPEVDSYSAFMDNAANADTGLDKILRGNGITDLDVIGLATEYCVKATVLDALELGYKVRLLTSGCRAINACPGDEERALQAVRDAGGSYRELRYPADI